MGTQHAFVQQMNLGEGIALNEALCENLFMILVSLLNQIPIFVIGKPGSSKSLAMSKIQSNLNTSEHILKNMNSTLGWRTWGSKGAVDLALQTPAATRCCNQCG